jgi:hypothetical protein
MGTGRRHVPTQFQRIIAELKKQERRLTAQLTNIRTAISLLEFGGGGVPAPAVIETPHAARLNRGSRKGGGGRKPAHQGKKRPARRHKKK